LRLNDRFGSTAAVARVGDDVSVAPESRPSATSNQSSYFRQLVVGKTGESAQTQGHEHGSSGSGDAPSG
jgi:hypothetical protein